MGFSEEITYPTTNDSWPKILAIGTVLKFFSILIVPQFLIQGFAVRVMRSTIEGDDECPPGVTSGNTWALMGDGFKLLSIFLIYNLVPILVFLFLVGGSMVAIVQGEGGVGLLGLLGGLVLSVVLFAAFNFTFGAAAANFAATGSFAAGFSPDVLTVMTSGAYIKAKLVLGGLLLGVIVLKSIIAVIPIVHFLLFLIAPLMVKYVNVVAARLWAKAYRETMETTDQQAEPQAQRVPA